MDKSCTHYIVNTKTPDGIWCPSFSWIAIGPGQRVDAWALCNSSRNETVEDVEGVMQPIRGYRLLYPLVNGYINTFMVICGDLMMIYGDLMVI